MSKISQIETKEELIWKRSLKKDKQYCIRMVLLLEFNDLKKTPKKGTKPKLCMNNM